MAVVVGHVGSLVGWTASVGHVGLWVGWAVAVGHVGLWVGWTAAVGLVASVLARLLGCGFGYLGWWVCMALGWWVWVLNYLAWCSVLAGGLGFSGLVSSGA